MSLVLHFKLTRPGFDLEAQLSLPGRGVTALFGPSGSGKTTLLRCVAGLERAEAGYLEVNGEVWQDDAKGIFVATHRRALGYVFQEASLFAHLSVRKNLLFGWQRIAPQARRVDMAHACALLGIDHLLERMPAGLSGGERQRVAIARALLTSPRLLLMDEPLAALDQARKREILPYLERLHDTLDIPVLYVSHQPEEVARLADHLVLLEQGRVRASAPLSEALANLDLPLAREADAGVVIAARVQGHQPEWHLTQLHFDGGALWVSQRPLAPDTPVRVHILARDVSIALTGDAPSSIVNRLPCVVSGIGPAEDAAQLMVSLQLGSVALLSRITRRSAAQLDLRSGQKVWAQVKAVALLE